METKRIVIKVGTSTLTHEKGSLNLRRMDRLARVLSDLRGLGYDIILVSSGAIAAGVEKLGLSERPEELRMKQAAAAVGQCELMHIYDKLFSEYNCTTAQILLTEGDVHDPRRTEHLKSTVSALFSMGVIPIVNENDSVSSEELETGSDKVLGDNDALSAVVAGLIEADLLILLTDIDGLYDDDPRQNPDAKLVHRVDVLTDDLRKAAGGAGSWRGTGGMVTKLNAAEISTNANCEMVIANGNRVEVLYDILEGKETGTRFCVKEK